MPEILLLEITRILLENIRGEEATQKYKEFKKARNECLSVFRKEQCLYYEQEIDPKRMWQTMKKLITVMRRKINVVQFDEQELENEKEGIIKLNQYFIEELMEAIPTEECSLVGEKCEKVVSELGLLTHASE